MFRLSQQYAPEYIGAGAAQQNASGNELLEHPTELYRSAILQALLGVPTQAYRGIVRNVSMELCKNECDVGKKRKAQRLQKLKSKDVE